MPIISSIEIYRGETVTLHFSMTPPKDITGWTISFTAAKARGSQNKLFQVTATITSGPNGTFDVPITNIQSNILPGTYAWDVWRVNPGFDRILGEGDFIISPSARIPL